MKKIQKSAAASRKNEAKTKINKKRHSTITASHCAYSISMWAQKRRKQKQKEEKIANKTERKKSILSDSALWMVCERKPRMCVRASVHFHISRISTFMNENDKLIKVISVNVCKTKKKKKIDEKKK